MAELVDALGSGPSARLGCGSSSLLLGTISTLFSDQYFFPFENFKVLNFHFLNSLFLHQFYQLA